MKNLLAMLLMGLLIAPATVMAQDMEPPEALNLYEVQSKIRYPKDEMEEEGDIRVVVEVMVNEKGRVKDYEFIDSPSVSFTKAVSRKLKKLRFRPAYKDGQATTSYVQVPFVFRRPTEN